MEQVHPDVRGASNIANSGFEGMIGKDKETESKQEIVDPFRICSTSKSYIEKERNNNEDVEGC